MTPGRLAELLGAPPVPQGSWERDAVYLSAATQGRHAESGGAGSPRKAVRGGTEEMAVLLRGLDGVASVTARLDGCLLIEVSTPGEVAGEIVAAGAGGVAAAGALVEMPWLDFPRTWDNPGFVIRYAHVRAVAVQRWARELGVPRDGFRPELLTDAHDRAVLRLLAELPSRTASRQPRWATYLERLAVAYHDAHERAPALPIGDGPVEPLHTARLWLAEAVRIVLDDLTAGALPGRL